MEILALTATISEQVLNELVARYMPRDSPVEEVRITVTPDGVVVKGEYPLLVTVSFETLWELSVVEGKVVAHLARLRTLGMPMTVLKSVVMGAIATAAKSEDWLQVDKDTVRMDIDRALTNEGLRAKTNLTAVRCEPGLIRIEAGKTPQG
jgi:hypothetical protein